MLSWPELLHVNEAWKPSRDTCILAAGCSAMYLWHLWVRGGWNVLKWRNILLLILPLPASCVPLCKAHTGLSGLQFPPLWGSGTSMLWCADGKVLCEPQGLHKNGGWWFLMTKVYRIGLELSPQYNHNPSPPPRHWDLEERSWGLSAEGSGWENVKCLCAKSTFMQNMALWGLRKNLLHLLFWLFFS